MFFGRLSAGRRFASQSILIAACTVSKTKSDGINNGAPLLSKNGENAYQVMRDKAGDDITRLLKSTSSTSEDSIWIYDTAPQRQLMKSLYYKSLSLSNNHYKNKNGVATVLIQGPKGIGKSTLFTHFVKHCPAEFPSVIPVYVTYHQFNTTVGNELENNSILDIVTAKLREHGIVLNDGESIASALEKNGKYVLLIVDEIDQLYRTHPSDTESWDLGLDSLHELNYLGSQITGRFCVYLCSSSTSCSQLMMFKADRDEFPRLNRAPRLKSSKYPTMILQTIPFPDAN